MARPPKVGRPANRAERPPVGRPDAETGSARRPPVGRPDAEIGSVIRPPVGRPDTETGSAKGRALIQRPDAKTGSAGRPLRGRPEAEIGSERPLTRRLDAERGSTLVKRLAHDIVTQEILARNIVT